MMVFGGAISFGMDGKRQSACGCRWALDLPSLSTRHCTLLVNTSPSLSTHLNFYYQISSLLLLCILLHLLLLLSKQKKAFRLLLCTALVFLRQGWLAVEGLQHGNYPKKKTKKKTKVFNWLTFQDRVLTVETSEGKDESCHLACYVE